MSFARNQFNEMLTNRQPDVFLSGFSYWRQTTAALGAVVFRRETEAGGILLGIDILTADVDKADAIRVYEDIEGARMIAAPGPAQTAMIVVPGSTPENMTPFFYDTRVLLYNGLALVQELPTSPVPPVMPPAPS